MTFEQDPLMQFYQSALVDAVELLCGDRDDQPGRLFTLYQCLDYAPDAQELLMATFGKEIADFSVQVTGLADRLLERIKEVD
mgnify:CR=1 FL=1